MELTRWLPIWRMRLVDARRLDHRRAILIEVDHRLFAVNVLAGLHGVDRSLLVPVVGGADDDRIDILARQDLVVVARRKNVVAPEFLASRQPAVVAVGRGDQFHARHLHSDPGVELALAPRADERDLDVIVGGDRFGRLGLFQFPFGRGEKVQHRASGWLPTPLRQHVKSSCD